MNAPAVPARRELRFDSLDDLLRDVQALAGTSPTSAGKWTAAQNIEHVAAVIDASVDGFTFSIPLPIRLLARLLRGRFLSRGLSPGIKLPAAAPAAFNPGPDTRFEDAAEHLAQAVQRAEERKMTAVSPVFGQLDHQQWVRFHCRHAELHFGFIQPARS